MQAYPKHPQETVRYDAGLRGDLSLTRLADGGHGGHPRHLKSCRYTYVSNSIEPLTTHTQRQTRARALHEEENT